MSAWSRIVADLSARRNDLLVSRFRSSHVLAQMPDGANLRESVLDREKLILTIKCGRPGTGMPAFDKFAYSDGRCYGLKQADLKGLGRQMPDPPATLIGREIEAIADFMLAKMVGKGAMDRAKCIDYWGADLDVCKEFAR